MTLKRKWESHKEDLQSNKTKETTIRLSPFYLSNTDN